MPNEHLLYIEGRPRIILTEWIPTGAHFIHTLQNRLGCHLPSTPGSVQEAGAAYSEGKFYITSEIDSEPNAATIDIGISEVSVRVLEYQHMEYIRLESRINIAATGGDQQEEVVGIEVTHDGRISYGMELDGRYSLDDIAHIIADLIEDTSVVMNTLLNVYQRRLLDVVFNDESRHRDKHILLMGDGLGTAEGQPVAMREALANPDYRAELAQVLGRLDLDNTQGTGDTQYLMPGNNAMLAIGCDSTALHDLLLAFSLMNSTNMFLSNMFSRVSWSWDCLNEQVRRIRNQEIEAIMDIQTCLSELSADQVLLSSVPAHLRRDKRHIARWMAEANVAEPAATLGLRPYDYMWRLFDNLDERLLTAEDAIRTLGEEIDNIRSLATNLGEKETHHINQAMRLLTVFSAVFLPLSLITGIYGMNFQAYRDPTRPLDSGWNMPELYFAYGYPVVLGLMVIIALSLLFYFRHVGLLGRYRRTKPAASSR